MLARTRDKPYNVPEGVALGRLGQTSRTSENLQCHGAHSSSLSALFKSHWLHQPMPPHSMGAQGSCSGLLSRWMLTRWLHPSEAKACSPPPMGVLPLGAVADSKVRSLTCLRCPGFPGAALGIVCTRVARVHIEPLGNLFSSDTARAVGQPLQPKPMFFAASLDVVSAECRSILGFVSCLTPSVIEIGVSVIVSLKYPPL